LKWRFPSNASIDSHSELVVWTDLDTTQLGLHANFKLSSAGDSIYLSNSSGFVIDSVYFGPQSSDISYFRCPNGVGSFNYTLSFTFNQSNCPTGLSDENKNEHISIFPNPTSDAVTVNSEYPVNNIKLYDLNGKCIMNVNIGNEKNFKLELLGIDDGIYLMQLNNSKSSNRIEIIRTYEK
jgi:hypothetical protein